MVQAGAALGPDGAGLWVEGPAGLAHFRLVTTPEAVHERQPLRDAQTQQVICFDGRLDNRAELFQTLGSKYAPAADAPDSELALAAYYRWGEDCPDHFTGDHAFVIWDAREQRLYCARSLGGWRPFQWWCDGKTFAFATEASQIIAGTGLTPRPNEGMIAETLAHHGISCTETLWQEIFRLPPGYALTVQCGGEPRLRRWYSGPPAAPKLHSEEDYIERFQELFDEALQACLRTHGTVAAHLSGGLDSSSVVCRAAELHRAGAGVPLPQPVSTLYPGWVTDESEWINAVANHAKLEVFQSVVAPYNWDHAREWVRQTGLLPIRPNGLSLLQPFQSFPSERPRVLLTGEGGDDWWRGIYAHWPDLLQRGHWRQLVRDGLDNVRGPSLIHRLRNVAITSLGPLITPTRRFNLIRGQPPLRDSFPRWMNREWAQRVGLLDRKMDYELPRLSGLYQQQQFQNFIVPRRWYNHDSPFRYLSEMRMEARHPFYDRRLAEFAMTAPGDLLRRKGEKKHLLRQSVGRSLPEKVRTRQTKAEFSPVIVSALTEQLTEESILRLAPVQNQWVNGQELQAAFIEHRNYVRNPTTATRPTRSLLHVWTVVSIDLWLSEATSLGQQ